MEIIQQVTQEFIKKIIEVEMTEGLSEYLSKSMAICKEYIIETARLRISEIDEILVDRPDYRKYWKVVKSGQPRTLQTQCGVLRYERRYYLNAKTKERAYLTDRLVGVDKYERVELGLSAQLCTLATEHSYAQSSDIACNGALTRQTVMSKLRQVKEKKLEPESIREDVKIVHIQADEDHVAMQDGRRDTIVKLAVIHEPVKSEGKRTYLPQRFCLTSYNEEPEDFWIRVGNEIIARYGDRKDYKVYIHGDGASWIKTGLDWVDNSKFVLDRYHLNKYMRPVSGGNPEYYKIMQECLKKDDFRTLKDFVEALVDQETSNLETAEKFMTYIRTNRDGIRVLYNDNEAAGGSCAEGLVSHILSSRLSSRPKGWMDKGVETVSRLRVYVKNGGKIIPEYLRKEKPQKTYGKKYIQQVMKNISDFAPMPTEVFRSSRRGSPEYRLFKSITKGRYAI